MTIEIETTREEIASYAVARRSGYAAALAAALGNGADWDWTGQVEDCGKPIGKCECGHHGLRYLFTLVNRNDGRTVEVGSTCVETYPGINPEVAAALEGKVKDLQAAARAREAAARKACQEETVKGLLKELSDIEYEIDAVVAEWIERHGDRVRKPLSIWHRHHYAALRASEKAAREAAGELHRMVRVPALKTPAGQAKKIRDRIVAAKDMLERVKAC